MGLGWVGLCRFVLLGLRWVGSYLLVFVFVLIIIVYVVDVSRCVSLGVFHRGVFLWLVAGVFALCSDVHCRGVMCFDVLRAVLHSVVCFFVLLMLLALAVCLVVSILKASCYDTELTLRWHSIQV